MVVRSMDPGVYHQRSSAQVALVFGSSSSCTAKKCLEQKWTMSLKEYTSTYVIAIISVGWVLLDIAVHIAVDKVEPLRIAGNLVGIFATCMRVLPTTILGEKNNFAKTASLASGICLTLLLNVVFFVLTIDQGVRIPMVVFVGVSCICLAALLRGVAFQKLDGVTDGTVTN